MLEGEITDSCALICPFSFCPSSPGLGEPVSLAGGDEGGNLKSRFIELERRCESVELEVGGGEDAAGCRSGRGLPCSTLFSSTSCGGSNRTVEEGAAGGELALLREGGGMEARLEVRGAL